MILRFSGARFHRYAAMVFAIQTRTMEAAWPTARGLTAWHALRHPTASGDIASRTSAAAALPPVATATAIQGRIQRAATSTAASRTAQPAPPRQSVQEDIVSGASAPLSQNA